MLQKIGNWADQIDALCAFLPQWFPALRDVAPRDVDDFLKCGAPGPLARFYGVIGGRTDLLSKQNHFENPEALTIDQGHLVFYSENQYVYEWSTVKTSEDPPVFVRETDTRSWQQESEPLSGFLCQAAVFEAIIGAPFSAGFGGLPSEVLDPILAHLVPLPFGPWLWPGDGMRFYSVGGALASVTLNSPGYLDFGCGALQPSDLAFLRPFVTSDWYSYNP